MDEMFFACQCCLNRRVRVFMVNGQIFEGVLVNVDANNLFLQGAGASISSKPVRTKGFFNPVITTLVLFDLLAIALLA